MRYILILMLTAGLAGCAGPAGEAPAGVDRADVYVAVLRRYLTGEENSFPGRTFPKVYVLREPIAEDVRPRITAAMPQVEFVATRDEVIVNADTCAAVRDEGILITLGRVEGGEDSVTVAVDGFVACMGGTSLTYVVERGPGDGWRVARTTGSLTVA